MPTYVAFLRGINVGGHRPVKMEDLKRAFASLGFANVRTHIQSGNVIFDAERFDPKAIATALKRFDTEAFIRTASHLATLTRIDPFKPSDEKRYVTFLPSGSKPALPAASSRGDVEIRAVSGCDVFSVSKKVSGRYGFPNGFIEKTLGVPATTRNVDVVRKISEIANP